MAWVDVLFVLSTLLAAMQLLPTLEDRRTRAPSCRAVVLRYWRRRAARILPAHLVTTLLAVVALGPAEPQKEAVVQRWMHLSACPSSAWANLLFIQNWLPAACPIHLWTVAIQARGAVGLGLQYVLAEYWSAVSCRRLLCEAVMAWHTRQLVCQPTMLLSSPPQVQFFVALPLFLCALRPRSPGFRTRLAAGLAACILGGTAWRLAAAWRAPEPLEFPIADFATDSVAQRSWAAMLHSTYLPTGARMAELAIGVALGALLTSPAALKAVQHRWAQHWMRGRIIHSAFRCGGHGTAVADVCMGTHSTSIPLAHTLTGVPLCRQWRWSCRLPTFTNWWHGRCSSASPAPSPGQPAARSFRRRCCGTAHLLWRRSWLPPWRRCCWAQIPCTQQPRGC